MCHVVTFPQSAAIRNPQKRRLTCRAFFGDWIRKKGGDLRVPPPNKQLVVGGHGVILHQTQTLCKG